MVDSKENYKFDLRFKGLSKLSLVHYVCLLQISCFTMTTPMQTKISVLIEVKIHFDLCIL